MASGILKALALAEMQSLLGSEPKLARAFGRLKERAAGKHLRTLCGEGVTYTNRRVRRLKAAFKALEEPATVRRSAGLEGLIADAIAAGADHPPHSPSRDAAILSAIERISHYGLASYTAIDRNLLGAEQLKAREILAPCIIEKRDAIAEMAEMAAAGIKAILHPRCTPKCAAGPKGDGWTIGAHVGTEVTSACLVADRDPAARPTPAMERTNARP